MRASRGMGAIAPSKMPKGTRTKRRDDTDFTQYAEGGTVNAAGNYTKAKRAGTAKGKQFVAQPKSVAKKTAGFR
jgi:hypothetical protein